MSDKMCLLPYEGSHIIHLRWLCVLRVLEIHKVCSLYNMQAELLCMITAVCFDTRTIRLHCTLHRHHRLIFNCVLQAAALASADHGITSPCVISCSHRECKCEDQEDLSKIFRFTIQQLLMRIGSVHVLVPSSEGSHYTIPMRI